MASEKKVPVKRETEYVVLAAAGTDAARAWTMLPGQPYLATTALEACKQAAAEHAGTTYEFFVAVPARSWKPMRRNVEQVTKETWTS